MTNKKVDDKVFIGLSEIPNYVSACFVALSQHDEIILIARGNHVKKALDILAIMIREYLDDSKYKIEVGSESYDKRFVTTISIKLSGKKKVNE